MLLILLIPNRLAGVNRAVRRAKGAVVKIGYYGKLPGVIYIIELLSTHAEKFI